MKPDADPTPGPEKPTGPATARGPVVDIEALGRLVHEIIWETTEDWPSFSETVRRRYRLAATAVHDAVLPEGWIVVPQAEHDALLRLIPDLLSACETSGDEFAVDGFVLATIDDIAAAHDAYKPRSARGSVRDG